MDGVEARIAQWRAYVAKAPAVDDRDVDELEAHLRDQIAELGGPSNDLHAGASQQQPGDRAACHPPDRLACAGAPAATMIAEAIFDIPAIIGVAGPVQILDIVVVRGFGIGVHHQHADRRTSGAALEDTRENLHLIRLLASRRNLALADSPAIQFTLDILLSQIQPGRAAIHNAADRGAVRLAPGGQAKDLAEGVAWHRSTPF